ncbi:MAG: flagellar biosynthesis protein FlhB, partial [Magnetovibrio sp.]|nr:flagellar biosynthesis protein FlhB [Magnetovibrio sp.]
GKIGWRFIEEPDVIPLDFDHLRIVLFGLLSDLIILLAPFFLLMMILAIASNLGQFGFLFSTKKIKPEISKISVFKGVKRMFSMRSTVEFLKGLVKLCVVTLVSLGMALPLLGDVELIAQIALPHTIDRIHLLAIALVTGTVGVMTVLAFLDFIYQKKTHMKQMRMTKQEVKDEQKQQEGDPQIKARIRKVRAERHQQRMMQAVPEADVVITNPTHFAVALKYKLGEMDAPICIAKGLDHLALRIRGVAEEHDVPIVENPPLARALYDTVELDQEIPPEHFTAVAEIIGYIMRQRGDLPLH